MEDIKLLLSTASGVLRDNKQAKAALGCGALALVVVLALIGGLNAATSAKTSGSAQDGQQAGGETSTADAGAERGDASQTLSSSTAPTANRADASLATTSIDSTGPYDILCGYSWADASTGAGYTFSQDGTLTLSYASSEGRTQTFAVGDAKKSDPTSSTYAENGRELTVTKTVYTFTLTLGGEEAKTAVLTALEYSDGADTGLTLSCSAFTGDLVGSPKTDAVAVEDLSGSGRLGELVDEGALSQALTSWCGSNAVGTTKATWDGKATVDYASGTASITLKLNNTTQKKVTCTKDAAGSYTFN